MHLSCISVLTCQTLSQQDTGWKLYLKIAGKLLDMVCMFYFFVISLDLMGSGFQLATGKVASSLFSESDLFSNPFFALMVGVLVRMINKFHNQNWLSNSISSL